MRERGEFSNESGPLIKCGGFDWTAAIGGGAGGGGSIRDLLPLWINWSEGMERRENELNKKMRR